MRSRRSVVGGEQSGHVVLLKQATTGDGLLTALHLMTGVAADRRSSRSWPGRAPAAAGAAGRPGTGTVLAEPAVTAAIAAERRPGRRGSLGARERPEPLSA